MPKPAPRAFTVAKVLRTLVVMALIPAALFLAPRLSQRTPGTRGATEGDFPLVPASATPLVRPVPPGDTHSWRAMRRAWKAEVDPNGWTDRRVTDLQKDDRRLFYVGDGELGCVDARSGRTLWRRPMEPGSDTGHAGGRDWRLSLRAGTLFVSESSVYFPGPAAPYLVQAFKTEDGKRLWSTDLGRRPYGRPTAVPGLVLVTTHDGELVALRERDGAIMWRREWATGSPYHGTAPAIHVHATGGAGVVQIGGDALAGFRLKDGIPTWRVRSRNPIGGSSSSEGFSASDGVAYADLAGNELVAVEIASGRRLWTRFRTGGESPSSAPLVVSGKVIVPAYSGTVALDRKTGKTIWYVRSPERWDVLPDSPRSSAGELLVKARTEPWIQGRQRRTLSVPELDTVLALDLETGQEVWRWQPHEGRYVERVLPAGDHLVLTDGGSLHAYAPGRPAPLPAEPRARRDLAARTIGQLLGGQYLHHSADGQSSWGPTRSEQIELRLRLLRLGSSSLLPLQAHLAAEQEEQEQNIPAPGELALLRDWGSRRTVPSALDLLVDLGDSRTVPRLLELLASARNPLSRDQLIEALIMFGDTRAAAELFRFARDEKESGVLRRGALYFACRAGEAPGLRQEQVTRYLLDRSGDPRAPLWLRRFAQFELLNGRGDRARRTALTKFRMEERAPLLPGVGTVVQDRQTGFGWPGFDGAAAARDERGTWWAAAASNSLGEGTDLWLAQSADRVSWVRPVFVADLKDRLSFIEEVKTRYSEGKLHLTLKGERDWKPVRLELTLSPRELHRDTDGDGLPDRLERRLGSDPQERDTDGNGVPDGNDKNAAYPPHTPTDEEAIYQVVVEALCQFGRTAPATDRSTDGLDHVPAFLGRKAEPLTLPLPPGSRGVRILGHPGPLLYRSSPPTWAFLFNGADNCVFTTPNIGVDGTPRARPVVRDPSYEIGDPYAPEPHPGIPPTIPFREFFPCELSRDGLRARVGWRESFAIMRAIAIGYDVEVRKIGGRWYPVECRQVYYDYGMMNQELPVPQWPLRYGRTPLPGGGER
jgi:outer membrane protein assembly factor BamB